MPETLKDQLIRHEGKRNKPYDDATGKELHKGDVLTGKLTIGIGWNLSDVPLPEEIINRLFEIAVQNATDDLLHTLPWTANLDWPRKAILINMTFNLGIDRLLKFVNTLTAIEDGKWQEAHDEMLKSKWAQQTGPRAIELARIMLTGEMGES